MSWHQIYDLPSSGDPVSRLNWTRAIVQNRLFMYRQDDLYILELDTTSVPGEPQIIAHTPTFLNMSGIQGIFQARGRLGAWDQENAIYWSDVDDLLDFVPSLKTLAAVRKLDDVKGKIAHVESAQEGFIVYTNANIVGMFEVSDNRVFRAIELDDKLGIFSSDHICIGVGGEHIIWSNGSLYKVNANRDPRRQAVEAIFPEIADNLRTFEGYPRLYHHNNRYFVISLTSKDFVPGKNVIQRRKVEGNTYFTPQHVFDMSFQSQGWEIQFMQDIGLNKPADYIEPASVLSPETCGPRKLFIPEEVPDYSLGYPEDTPSFQTEGYQPPPECEFVLWAYHTKIQPRLKLEQLSYAGNSGCWSPSADSDTAVELDSWSNEYCWWQDGVIEDWRSVLNDEKELDYTDDFPFLSFSSYSLMLHQIREWKERYNNNRNQAQNLKKDLAVYEGYLCDVENVGEAIDTTIIDAPAIFPVTATYTASSTAADTDGVSTHANGRLVRGSAGTVQSTYSRQLKRRLTRYEKGQEPYPDWTTTSSNSSAYTQDINGTFYLNGTRGHAMETDESFQRYFYPGADSNEAGQWHDPILQLGQSYPTEAADLWATVMNLVGMGDGCTYAKASSHAARRAWNKSSTFTLVVESKNELYQDDPVDPAFGFYYTKQRITTEYEIDVDRLLLEAAQLPAAGGYRGVYGFAPQREIARIYPVANISHPDGTSPKPYLIPYYEQAEQLYPDENRIDAVLGVYEDNGWTVVKTGSTAQLPPNALQLEDLGSGYLEPPTWDLFNQQKNSGFFSELHDQGTRCGRQQLGESPIVPEPTSQEPETFYISPTPVDNKFGTDGWKITQPDTVLLEGSDSTGATYPVYNIALVWDEHLQKWGLCAVPHEVFISHRPENENAYNPLNTETTSALTYRDFFAALGAILPNGLTVVWNDQPDQSYLVIGKNGLDRLGFSTWVEGEFEFADIPNGLVGFEFSEDGKLINPYKVKLKQATQPLERFYLTESGRYSNFLVFGHYHLIQVKASTVKKGNR